MCKYCSKPCNNENILDTCSADGYSFQKIYIARVIVPSHESFIPKERFCLVVRHAFMGNSCETVTPIDYCIKCGRNLEDTTMSNLNHDENFSLKKEYVVSRLREHVERLKAENERLEAKLEAVADLVNGSRDMMDGAIAANNQVSAMRERRMKRALYKACANWAKVTRNWDESKSPDDYDKWYAMEYKCLKKAEELK